MVAVSASGLPLGEMGALNEDTKRTLRPNYDNEWAVSRICHRERLDDKTDESKRGELKESQVNRGMR